MHEYKCKKCKKSYDHFLKLNHPCACGGELKEIHHRTPCYPKLDFNPSSHLITEFEPVRRFGGFGDIWYYRKKRTKGKLKL